MSEKLENSTPVPFCGCRIWLGGVDKDGYGRIGRPGGTSLKAHREAYREWVGPIPDGAHVLHTCDTPACIEPKHLYLGDPAQNGADKASRGRARAGDQKGGNNAMHKLQETDIFAIRELSAAGILQREIAAIFGVRQGAISKIVRGERWKHI